MSCLDIDDEDAGFLAAEIERVFAFRCDSTRAALIKTVGDVDDLPLAHFGGSAGRKCATAMAA